MAFTYLYYITLGYIANSENYKLYFCGKTINEEVFFSAISHIIYRLPTTSSRNIVHQEKRKVATELKFSGLYILLFQGVIAIP